MIQKIITPVQSNMGLNFRFPRSDYGDPGRGNSTWMHAKTLSDEAGFKAEFLDMPKDKK